METNIGIVFELDEATQAQAIELSQHIGKEYGAINLLGNGAIPHITLFQGRFPDTNKEKIYRYVKSLQDNHSPIEICLNKKLFVRKNLNVFWMVTLSSQLMCLHLDIAKYLFPLTENLLMDQFVRLLNSPNITISERERLESYGMLLSGDAFMPHVTLCKLNSLYNKNKISGWDAPQSSFRANCIAIGELGFYGNLVKIVHRVMLSER